MRLLELISARDWNNILLQLPAPHLLQTHEWGQNKIQNGWTPLHYAATHGHVAVMYLGVIVEQASTPELFMNPRHPYTQALLDAAPVANPKLRRTRAPLQGDPPSPISPPSGCRFRTRCPYATELCAAKTPKLRELHPGHLVACHYAEDLSASRS